MPHKDHRAAMGALSAGEVALAAVLILAFLFGGGSVLYPLQRTIVLVAALALVCWLVASRGLQDLRRQSLLSRIAIGGVFVLPLVQLVPLPPGAWHHFPGNDLRADILHLLGEEDRWLPISLAPQATARWALAAIVPLGTFAATLGFGGDERRRIGILIVALALASALLGFVQFSSGGTLGAVYDTIYTGDAVGFFSNRNHFAALAYAAIPLACVLCRSSFDRVAVRWAILLCILAILLFSALVSASRAGLLLALLAVPLGLLAGADHVGSYLNKRTARIALSLFAAGFGVCFMLIAGNTVVSTITSRFGTLGLDYRATIWSNSWPLVWEHMPFGSGMGTFVPVYAASEPFEALIEQYVNHAHQDYLEMVIEGGVLAIGLMLTMLVVFGRAALGLLRRRNPDILARGAACSLLLLLLHSLVDYPLRTFCLLAIAGVLAGLVVQQAASETVRRRTKKLPGAGPKPERA